MMYILLRHQDHYILKIPYYQKYGNGGGAMSRDGTYEAQPYASHKMSHFEFMCIHPRTWRQASITLDAA